MSDSLPGLSLLHGPEHETMSKAHVKGLDLGEEQGMGGYRIPNPDIEPRGLLVGVGGVKGLWACGSMLCVTPYTPTNA